MYMNLKAEMARNGITNEQLANGIGINPATMSAKLNIAGRMRLDEAQCLRDKFFPEMTMDYLFGDVQPTDRKRVHEKAPAGSRGQRDEGGVKRWQTTKSPALRWKRRAGNTM